MSIPVIALAAAFLPLRLPVSYVQTLLNMAATDNDSDTKQEKLESGVHGMRLKEEESDVDMDNIPESVKQECYASLSDADTGADAVTPRSIKKSSRSPVKAESILGSPAVKPEEDTVGGDVELRLEPGRPPTLTRTKSKTVVRRPPPLFFDYENKTAEATSSFSLLTECIYANKYLGTTEHALECDCVEEWGKSPPR